MDAGRVGECGTDAGWGGGCGGSGGCGGCGGGGGCAANDDGADAGFVNG